MAGGRPTDYNPDFCARVIEHGRAGKSLTYMAGSLEVAKQSIYTWMELHPEFLDAMTQAKQLSQMWWEDAGQDNMLLGPGQGTFNGSVWSRSMGARFPDDWREKSEQSLSGGVEITKIVRTVIDP